MNPGVTSRELVRELDPVTNREVWRLTSTGINAGISFHYRSQFTDDSRYLVFHRRLDTHGALMRADLKTGELTVITTGPGHETPSFAIVPRRRAVVTTWSNQLRLIDLESLRENILIDRFPDGFASSCAFGTLDGSFAGYALHRRLSHPVTKSHTYDTAEFDAYVREYGGRPGMIGLVNLDTGGSVHVCDEPVASGNHIQPSPTDPDVWLIERDQPPLFSWMGDHGRTPRIWLLNWRTGQCRPISTRNDNHFQMHSCWLSDGLHIVYHGRDRATAAPIGQNGGGHYIGVASIAGDIIWEEVFPHFYYGHVAGHARPDRFIIDSLTAPDLLQEVAYLEPGAPMRVLGRHGSEVRYGRQDTHPHPQISPDGSCLAYNRFDGVRCDVCLLWLAT